MSKALTIGVDASFLNRDDRGMGRCIRAILNCWQKSTKHRFILLCYARRHLKTLASFSQEGWAVDWSGTEQHLDVCWFPWSRVDWDPGCPKVAFIHDVAAFACHQSDDSHREQDQMRVVDAAAQADRVMTNSNFSRIEIHRHLGLDLDAIDVVHLAYDAATFHPSAESEVPLPEGVEAGNYLLFVGNVEKRKNLHGLLEAYSLIQRDARLPLVLVCPRPTSSWTARLRGYHSALERWAEQLEEHLIWLDHVDDRTLVELYRRARLFVMPSLYEGFGLPLLEAMACGAPVAAGQASSLPEVGGQVPTWFNPLDPVDIAQRMMEALADDPPDPAAGFEQARKFSWQSTADQTLEVLETAAHKPVKHGSGKFSAVKAALAALGIAAAVTIEALLSAENSAPLLVLGDLMLDHWVWGSVSRISPEAPIPVVDVESYTYTPGGAANVVANLLSLGARVSLGGVVGKDDSGRRLRSLLRRQGVDVSGVLFDPSRPTTLKSRIVAHAQQVVRADYERRHPLSIEIEGQLLSWFQGVLPDFRAVFLSDYLKGFFTPSLLEAVIHECQNAKKPLVVGPKPTNVPLFRGATLLALNAREAAEAAGMPTGNKAEVERAGAHLQGLLPGTTVVVTRGADGMSMFTPGEAPRHMPALASQVYDVSGAGDTVLASLGLAAANGLPPADSLTLASHAAAVVVRKVGTATATPDEILESLRIHTPRVGMGRTK